MTGKDTPSVPQPAGLGTTGAAFWVKVTAQYGLRLDELVVLESACRTLDVLARLDAEVAGQPLTVPGSMGQMREHPLISEARQQRAALARLVRQLELPDEVTVGSALSRSSSARTLANARWSRRGA
ncbi:hypothetical protein ACXR2U_04825 [Jatrophihabitans sp. YIM 134969]